jgi:eukaryotic-like serine/threonine-protein kinase
MDAKHWDQIEELFHAALAMDAGERPHYLRQACLGNGSLQKEVESLISALESSDGFMEHPAFELGMEVLRTNQTETMLGKTVAAYRVLRRLGKGGMGEVFLAQDTRLGRNVALKFLSPEFVGDNWAKRQLIKEAQAVAMLDHPNICPVYGIEEHEGHSFIVMQYVEGETLADMIRTQALSADRVLPLARQIVGALAEAHASGIIHRDIKPRNMMVTNGGQMKVLDFGLAKTIQAKKNNENAPDSISHLAQTGLLVGTVAYMSPEQLRGEKLDYRSDIFGLGTVLYEMASGGNPFARDTNAETISAILTSSPPSLRQNGSQVGRDFERVVQKCLEKDRNRRYQSASELLIEWENVARNTGVNLSRLWSVSVGRAIAIAMLLLLISVLFYVYRGVTRQRTIAILPIADETGDPSVDYLADGLSKSIIDQLSDLHHLKVKAFSIVSGYKGQVDPLKIGRELGVDYVVIGKISGAGHSMSLQVSMIESEDGSQSWGKTYPLDPATTLSIQGEIAKQITSYLELLPRTDDAKLAGGHRPTQAAFEEYLRGLDAWSVRKKENIDQAIAHFTKAKDLDPSYALAYAGLADCYVLLNVVSYGNMETQEAMAKAEWAARRAVDIEPDSAEAHAALGVVQVRSHWNWQAAGREFDRAIQLKPDYAPAHLWYSELLAITGDPAAAIAESKRAKDLDPFSPATMQNYCRSFYFARQYDEATRCLDKLDAEYPGDHGRFLRGYIDMKKGLYADAIEIFKGIYARDKSLGGAALGYAYGFTGNKPEAFKVLHEMLRLSEELKGKNQELPQQELALIYLGLGDRPKAFALLEKSAEAKFWPFTSVAVDPFFDSERSDPAFVELVRKLNLPQGLH